MPLLTVLDWVIVGVVAISAVMSIFRGFIREASSILTWVVAFVVASRFYEPVAAYLTFSSDNLTRLALSSIILFIGVLLVMGLLSNLVCSFVKKAGLSGFDRMLGIAFGVVRGILIVCAVLALFQILSKMHILSFVQSYPWFKESVFVPELQRIVNWFFVYMGTPETGV